MTSTTVGVYPQRGVTDSSCFFYNYFMDYEKEHHQSILERWKEERAIYLEQAHIKEEEVRENRFGQYFYVDRYKILMPTHLSTSYEFERYLKRQ